MCLGGVSFLLVASRARGALGSVEEGFDGSPVREEVALIGPLLGWAGAGAGCTGLRSNGGDPLVQPGSLGGPGPGPELGQDGVDSAPGVAGEGHVGGSSFVFIEEPVRLGEKVVGLPFCEGCGEQLLVGGLARAARPGRSSRLASSTTSRLHSCRSRGRRRCLAGRSRAAVRGSQRGR